MPTLLVFGGGGQLATALARAPLPQGWRVRAPRRAEADITRPDAIAAALGAGEVAAVVNAAAYTAVDRAEAEPAQAAAINRDGAGNVAAACAARGLPLVHVSTDYVFDGRKAGPYREDDPVAPLGVYGRTKAEGEAAVRAAAGRHVVLRTSWVYGPVGHNFVRTMLRLGRERPELRVVDDQTGSPTATADLADAIVAVALRLAGDAGAGLGTFHYCGEGVTTWRRFAEAIFAEAARHGYAPPRVTPIATADYPTAARRPANSALDCGRIARIYGIRPRPWREALARCIDAIAASGDLA